NVNTCWVGVNLEDKINPFCKELEDKTEDCDDFHNGELGEATDTYVALEGKLRDFYDIKFGDPTKECSDNLSVVECGELTYEQQYKLSVSPCGEQIAHRRYRAKDWSDNYSSWVEQKITIKYKANWSITFPADWDGSCGDMAPAEDIVISNGACDLLGYEVTEKQFDIPGDACFKIERTYHVINWCKFVAGQDPEPISRVQGDHNTVSATNKITSETFADKGYFTYVQVLKVHDNVAPVVTVINPEPCINGIDFDAAPYGEEDITPGAGPFECDEEKTWSATATDCSSNITWEGRLYNAATGALVKTSDTHEIKHIVSNKETYYAEFWAYDNCGNSAGNKGTDVKFWDCKKPTPFVLNGIAVDLGETATVQVWASDLNQNSFDNCTDQSKLDFRIWADFLDGDAPTGTGKGDADASGVSALGKVLTFGCERVGTNVVYIYVIDEEGNWDFAQTYAIVQDNMNVCNGNDPQGGMVAGTIVNANGENVEAVNITVTGGAEESMTTSTDGQFQFSLATGADYILTPVKDINPLNGVSTFDLVLISKHILGITTFDSPYKHIAADVNKSGSITAFDMVQLRQLILNITTEFSSNDSWRFVDANHNFASANPASENFNEFYNITALNGTMQNMDFVGVKIGDVNGNAQANSLLGAESRTVNGALTLTTTDRFVEAGETVTVAFTAAEIANTLGYQFTLNVAGQNAEIVEGVAKAANFNTNLAERGVITTSWNGEATATEELFAVTFNATASGLLSELVSVSSDVTTAEAYNTAGELMDVNIDFTTTAAAGFTLAQNTPNPFTDVTTIGFNLPEAGTAVLTVMDVQGKVLKSIRADYAKGANQVSLNANELGATGVLYYQLESADNVATKKMIILE
ncbi:MAG: T9SS type A sorting domain-containing protein, partial [Saprospiraceae bacterium]